ncbi:MAG TPA: hypothetical protein G4O01_02095 [Dehalococcoidia bacterium]|nr:hypothetical protein [Dehalococcoidia bacterium]
MSKLIDRLNRVSKGESKPIGFRAASSSTKAKMLLMVDLAQADDIEQLADSLGGADAVLIERVGSGAKSLKKVAQSLPDVPWGLRLAQGLSREIKPAVEAGLDFVVFPLDSALDVAWDDGMGRVLEMEPSLSEGLLRAVSALPVDAVLIAGKAEETRLTWHHLALFQRFADLLTKPLLAQVPLGVTAGELQALWRVGVDGVVVAKPPRERLKELCQMIGELTLPSRAGEKKMEALLPRLSGEALVAEAEEDGEEE